ncbi:O-fucosyltransferase 11 [Vitis vinifera]|uniref:O-fucosyltransferase family protein n=1 Tax=Vitis vinifera TaxID=29760 RepID=A0A438KMV8_VITVI|nr:O-fucosyltransferase 11 [Vitis vinifera]
MKSKNQHHTTPVCNGNTSESSSPSPPPSPRRHSAVPHCRRLLRSKTFSQSRRESSVAGIIIRRGLRYFLLLPLFYISGLLMCVGPFSGLVWQAPLPGSVYRSHEIFEKLWHEIESDNSSAIELSSVWRYNRRLKEQKPCPNTSYRHHFATKRESPDPSGYLIVEANGGLNQQRSSSMFSLKCFIISVFILPHFESPDLNFWEVICNAVAVAGLLNAILVIPHLDFHSVWVDPRQGGPNAGPAAKFTEPNVITFAYSEFGDIYDEDHFITTLKGFVEVVQELPEVVMERYDYNITNIPNIRIESWAPIGNECSSSCSIPEMLSQQRSMRFSFPVSTLARKLVKRMIEKSSRTGGKTWWPSHAVYMMEEKLKILKMDLVREKGWRGKFRRKDRLIQPGLNRINGKCPSNSFGGIEMVEISRVEARVLSLNWMGK